MNATMGKGINKAEGVAASSHLKSFGETVINIGNIH